MINGQLAHALGRKKARIHGMRSGKWGHRKPAGVPRVKKVGHAGVNRAWPDITSNVGRLLYTGFSCAQSLRRMNSLIFLRSYRCFCAFTGRSSALRNGCLSLLTISEMTSRDLIIGIILSRIEHSLINANAIKGQSGGVPPGWNEGRHEQVHVHCSDKMGTIPLQSSGYFYFATNSRGKVRSGRGWKTRVTRRKTLNKCSLCFQGGRNGEGLSRSVTNQTNSKPKGIGMLGYCWPLPIPFIGRGNDAFARVEIRQGSIEKGQANRDCTLRHILNFPLNYD